MLVLCTDSDDSSLNLLGLLALALDPTLGRLAGGTLALLGLGSSLSRVLGLLGGRNLLVEGLLGGLLLLSLGRARSLLAGTGRCLLGALLGSRTLALLSTSLLPSLAPLGHSRSLPLLLSLLSGLLGGTLALLGSGLLSALLEGDAGLGDLLAALALLECLQQLVLVGDL